MPNEIKVEKHICMKLQQDVRDPISKMNLKKTGYNKNYNYYYYDLSDFEAEATELFAKAGLCPIYNVGFDPNTGIEMATLDITDGMNTITFRIPTADVPRMDGIFNLGSKDKYCLRYLLVNHVLMLSEQDEAELSNGPKEEPQEKPKKVENVKATKEQVDIIRGLYDAENIGRMLEYYQVNSLEDLSVKQASEAIGRKKK